MTANLRRLSLAQVPSVNVSLTLQLDIKTTQVQSLLVAPLHHLSSFHLALNLVSFAIKAVNLEKRFSSQLSK